MGSDFSSSFSGLVARYFSPAFSEENYTVLCGNRLSSLNFHWFYNNLRSPSRHWPDWAQAALSLHRPVFPVLAQCSLLPALCPHFARALSAHLAISPKNPLLSPPRPLLSELPEAAVPPKIQVGKALYPVHLHQNAQFL